VELLNAGYVVLSTSHPGTVGDDQTAAGRYRLWDRSRDVSSAIDEVVAIRDGPRSSTLAASGLSGTRSAGGREWVSPEDGSSHRCNVLSAKGCRRNLLLWRHA